MFRTAVKKLIPHAVFRKVEPLGHLAEAILANIQYGFPARDMKIIGVTGTNGKTTTSFMIQKMLSQAGIKTGLMTTVAYGIDNAITPQIAHMTTASAGLLQKRLAEFKKQGVQWVVLETTSHALAQYRTWGIPYEIAVMTNVTHEHLDYHGTFKGYLEAKRRLFKIAAKNGKKLGVVNNDDENAELFIKTMPNSVSYGIKSGNLIAKDVLLESDGCRYTAAINSNEYTIHCHIPGEFNVYNSLAAVAVGRSLGLTRQQIELGIDALTGVEGRMTVIDEGQPFKVIIDFAHTPDSFERLLSDLRAATKGKLIAVFGSAGRRDEAKRAIQGEIAGRHADEIVLTEEDDRDIDGEEILEQIAGGAITAGKVKDKDMFLVHNRSEAIEFSFTRASSPDDTVILLGKGHEKSIEGLDGERPWNEADEARKALHNLIKR